MYKMVPKWEVGNKDNPIVHTYVNSKGDVSIRKLIAANGSRYIKLMFINISYEGDIDVDTCEITDMKISSISYSPKYYIKFPNDGVPIVSKSKDE